MSGVKSRLLDRIKNHEAVKVTGRKFRDRGQLLYYLVY